MERESVAGRSRRFVWWRVCVLLLPITAESVAGIRPPSDAELRHCWQALLQLRHLLLGELLHAPLQLLRGMLAIACLPGCSVQGPAFDQSVLATLEALQARCAG
ncbi:unnamed protein product [Effrenium voratum]|nr:unnamed protein product [Effrenium voratum]